VFYPSGSIEMKDHRDGADYREESRCSRDRSARKFRGGVTVERVRYLGEVKVPAVGLTFLHLLDRRLVGDPGAWTWEDGAPHARLLWVLNRRDRSSILPTTSGTGKWADMLRRPWPRS
jgi:hypothetical protein